MSKSLGNYIGIDEPPQQIFGKVMSLSDETMWLYFELISFKTLAEIKKLREQVQDGLNPRDVKFILAEEIVARFHDQALATTARENFIAQFQQGAIPEDLTEINLSVGKEGLSIAHIIKMAGLTPSTSEAVRMLQQGAVRIDGEKVTDQKQIIQAGANFILQVGKRRFAKVGLSE